MDCREPREFTVWRNQVQAGMLMVIRLKIKILRVFLNYFIFLSLAETQTLMLQILV